MKYARTDGQRVGLPLSGNSIELYILRVLWDLWGYHWVIPLIRYPGISRVVSK